MGNCIWWMDGYNDGHDEEKKQRRGFPSKLHTSVFCHWWLRWRLNSLFLYFLSCWWKLNSFYFVIIFIFLLIYFLFLVLNSPPRLAGAFFSILEWIRRLCCFYHTEVLAVWWGLGAAWREQRKRTRSLELFLWFDLFTGWTEEDRASWREESFVLCFVFYTLLFLADSVMGVGGLTPVCLKCRSRIPPSGFTFFFRL